MGLPTNSSSTPDTPRPQKRTGLLRALFAFKHSYAGLRSTWRAESAFRQETVCALVLVPCALLLPIAPIERVALIGSVLLVLVVELLNSAIEAVVDRISLDRHELSGRAKDCGSAAVLVSLLICVLTWVIVLWPLGLRWLRAHP
ncbi:Diacylglycerol kinase [Trinickia soli]|uniref:Diacylglycerol kinase n=2 Tax=Trinickia soli TaxID=380675 RepID=A0A2N7WG74_9BURK|nr:diacylglycerol kinase [Trinickia soli]PMS28315.1 diacylglycerol kinase [Trinickia soli]CAB3667415.1 Diacylglycerol kinase [Trinickia soli]